jgi:Carboxypeptidase regulatory-like domain/TonB dependent receptor-like, beta-barrel
MVEAAMIGVNAMKVKTQVKLFEYAIVLTICLGWLIVFSPQSYAQSTYGSVTGTITDTTGGALADVDVTLVSRETGSMLTDKTGVEGYYQFKNLMPGHYRVGAEKAGFKRSEQADVVVQVQQTSSINLTMQLGATTQTVEVTAETPLLQPDSSSLGQVISGRQANEIPLNGRNVFNLASLSPSVVPQGSAQGTTVGKNPFDTGNYQVGGSFANQSVEYLDGQPLNIGYINLPLLVPTQDSIGEFKVQYNNLGPEWGKFSGGVINFSTKSGTNVWHGTAYEFLRNRVLNANNPFNKASQIENGEPNKAPPFTQNQFGGTVGGPIIKDKTFVFGSYEGYRARAGQVFSTIVPTTAERAGNFADMCVNGFNTPDPFGSGINICSDQKTYTTNTGPQTVYVDQLYNPLTVDPVTGRRLPIANNNLTGMNPVTGQPYINPTANYLLNQAGSHGAGLVALPTTDVTGQSLIGPNAGVSNFTAAASTGGDIDQYVARVDQNLTESQHLFGRYTYFKQLSLAQDPYNSGLCKDRCAEHTTSNSGSLGWTYAIDPTLTASFNGSVSRFHYLRGPILSGFDMTQEFWPASYNPTVPDTERTPLTPCFANSDSSGSGNISCSQGQSAINDWDTQWNLSAQMTKVHGRHTFSFGGQFTETLDNYLQTNNGGAIISFNGSWTAALASNKGLANGSDYADFLLGYGLGAGAAFGNQVTGNLVISAPVAGRENYEGFFFNDTWRVNNKLTLNLGLRYELAGPWTERFNRLTYFDPKATNASATGCSGTAGSACPGDIFYVGVGSTTGANPSRSSFPLNKNEWSPRLGFAYQLNPKTVIRGGYGIFYSPNYVSFAVNPYVDPTSSATSSFFASNNAGLSPASTLDSSGCVLLGTGGVTNTFTCTQTGPFGPNLVAPVGRNALPNISAFGIAQTPLTNMAWRNYNPAYTQQWNLDLQRELPWGFFLDVAYAGAHGVHLQQFRSFVNQIPDSFISQAASQYDPTLADPCKGVTICQKVGPLNYPFSTALPGNLGPTSLINGQLDRPYPQYTDVQLGAVGCCSSSYNALQVSVNKRFQGGGVLLVAYTNAKLLSNTDTLTSWLESNTTGGIGNVQDWNNLKNERSLSSQDVSQRLIISYVYDLPFGHGQKFMSGATGVKDKLVAGWGVNGITTFQKGFPLKITDGNPNLLASLGLGTGTIRPNVVPGCNKTGPRNVGQWFNTACFADPAAYVFGNESRVDPTLRQDGINNWDFALFKKTYFGPESRFNVEFRTEFFNIFNIVQFGPPNTAFGNQSFGKVSGAVNNPRLIQFGLRFSF